MIAEEFLTPNRHAIAGDNARITALYALSVGGGCSEAQLTAAH
jgi:hypothetical protein